MLFTLSSLHRTQEGIEGPHAPRSFGTQSVPCPEVFRVLLSRVQRHGQIVAMVGLLWKYW
jgi:hypothetical protein